MKVKSNIKIPISTISFQWEVGSFTRVCYVLLVGSSQRGKTRQTIKATGVGKKDKQ